MIIEYNGANYVGWQVQPNGLAVQEVIEKQLERLVGVKTVIHASGRTDSGVHAYAQVAHFDTESRIPADKFSYALNTSLPADIRIKYSGEASPDFHSRFSAKHKQYRYAILHAPHASAFYANTALHIHSRLDFDKMSEAAKLFVGKHDFNAYKASGTDIENTVREIYLSEWKKDKNMLYYFVEGNGFLYNMVRILTGTMLDVGMGRMSLDDVKKSLEVPERKYSGQTAPAHGLTLMRVRYDDFDTDEILENLTKGF